MATAVSTTIPEAPAATLSRGRLLSLDVFRGATILAMILVNNPGEWGEKSQYWPLDHAAWHGWTPTDLIFPFFLFIVGSSISYSFRKYRHGAQIDAAVYWRITHRTVALIFLGWMPTLLLKSIGYFHEGTPFDLSNLRIFGVLVRIAIVYFFASLIVLGIPLRGQVALAGIILLGYWATLAFLPDPHDYWKNLSNEHNVTVVVDRALVGDKHMYHGDPPTEPEGFLSTFPAIVTALTGYLTGLFIQRRGINYDTVARLAACGLTLAIIGQSWHYIFPINKKLGTSSFVLLTGGLAMILLAACLMVFDIRGWRRLARPFEIVGVNAIFVFVASGLLAILLRDMRIEGISAHAWLYHQWFTSWIHDPKLASLGMALLTVAFWWFICWFMSLFGLAIRV
jgi:predicted acyltransferase